MGYGFDVDDWQYQIKHEIAPSFAVQDETNREYIEYLGLAGETGEVLELAKKLKRDGMSEDVFRNRLKFELGDVLVYVSLIASRNGLSLHDIMRDVKDKLEDRVNRNVQNGSGDFR